MNAPIMQQAQMSNAQQQQMYNLQQQQMQVPQVQSNQLFTNAQMQMQANQVPMNMQMPVQQIAPPMMRNNIGVYGRTREPPAELPGIFNDDEHIIESVKEVGKEGKLDIQLIAQRSQVKLGEKTLLPAMCQVISSGGARTSVDLVCVIDVSGSMSG